MDILLLLRQGTEQEASDLHLSVGLPPLFDGATLISAWTEIHITPIK